MQLMAQEDPCSFVDRVHVTWKAWAQENTGFNPQGIQAIRAVFDFCFDQNKGAAASPSREPAAYAIFKGRSFNHRHSPPS
jgi:hypothetical protein